MKKFIVAFDGLKFSKSVRDYAIQSAKHNDAHLVGVFLEDFTYHSYGIYDIVEETEGISLHKQKQLDKKDAKARATAVTNFEEACQDAGIDYTIHHDKSIALQELLHESIYADLLIIDVNETLTHYTEKVPTRFIRDLLANTECPVLVVPHQFKFINKLTLLYDGAPSSVYAIKMFSYIFTSLKHNDIEILTVKENKSTVLLPDNKLMKEFIKKHFPRASYTILKGTPEVEIVNYLKQKNNSSLIVLGAYNRGAASRWFRTSMADILMKELNLPLFIAHSK